MQPKLELTRPPLPSFKNTALSSLKTLRECQPCGAAVLRIGMCFTMYVWEVQDFSRQSRGTCKIIGYSFCCSDPRVEADRWGGGSVGLNRKEVSVCMLMRVCMRVGLTCIADFTVGQHNVLILSRGEFCRCGLYDSWCALWTKNSCEKGGLGFPTCWGYVGLRS